MKTDSYGNSDIGLSRLNNEDVWATLPNENFFIVADGMGGHKAGEVAANETVLDLCRLVKQHHNKDPKPEEWTQILEEGITTTNQHVYDLSKKHKEYEGMGTTLCLTLFTGSHLIYAHVGDSRIYRVRKGRITQLTRDHSLKDDLIARGELDESLSLSFPYKNVITRAIGTHPEVKPDIDRSKTQIGDTYLLCSDGLTDPITDAQIHDIIDGSPNAQTAGENLILAAKKEGGNDNITVIVIKIR